ncbi:MAG: hypothetical protein AAF652_19870, partial [Cyanobacteria bacterium P01_C01_bin.72]
ASLYLQHGQDSEQTQAAGQHLRWSIQKHLPILRQSFMQKLLLKFALRYFLPPEIGRKVFERLRKLIATDNPLAGIKSKK